jgi:acetyl-CoA C-acetyltransferase
MRTVVIVRAKRTPIGRFLGSFTDITAVELGTIAVKGLFEDGAISPSDVDEVIFGNATQAGNKPNPARQVLKGAGIPYDAPAYTVNMACASSLKCIALAYQSIAMGDMDVVVAGGTENMTRRPFILDRMRKGYRLGDGVVIDGMYHDGLMCPLCEKLMGRTVENIVEKYGITRQEQDVYAALSQQRCETARKEGKFLEEIIPVQVKDKVLKDDEHPRDGVTVEKLSKLPPVFKKPEEGGIIHAGAASGIADGAAAVLLMAQEKAQAMGIKPLARIVGYTSVGLDPEFMGMGPVYAVQKLEKKTGIKLEDYDIIEINEAFAAQVLACQKELKFDLSKTNINGGAIALGHPIAATGARMVTTMLYEMKRRGFKRGLATLCVSGGLGMAMAFERE